VRKLCSYLGCTNNIQKGGVCVRHGVKVVRKLCSHEGCINKTVKGGVCIRHGAIVAKKLNRDVTPGSMNEVK
jgi:hypothetical protein